MDACDKANLDSNGENFVSIICAAPGGLSQESWHKTISSILDADLPSQWELVSIKASHEGKALIEHFKHTGERRTDIFTVASHLVPHLWSAALKRCEGNIILFTSGGLLAAKNWVRSHLSAHQNHNISVVGGGFVVAPSIGMFQKAIAWSRYSAYYRIDQPREVIDLAADNASYKRCPLQKVAHLTENGFWEPAIHAAISKNRGKLVLIPDCNLTWVGGVGLFISLKQRLLHGYEFGRGRPDFFGAKRVIFLVLSWSLPLILISRCTKRMRGKGVVFGELMRTIPSLLLIYLAWSIGEVLGVAASFRCAPSQKHAEH